MSWPELDPAELARRLDVSPDTHADVLLMCLDVARAWIDPRADEAKSGTMLADAAYLEGCYQLAVKVYDTGSRGMVTTSDGEVDFTAVATSGMWRSVLGVVAPALKLHGVVIG